MVAIIALLLLLLPIGANATTYYVATTGSNSNDGLSESTPYLTIQKCVDMMVAGDTCNVGGGTYSATGVRFNVSGSSGSPITLQAKAGSVPILSCTGTTLEANSILIMTPTTATTSYRTPIGWINISGFEITNCHDGIKWYNFHDGIISNLTIHDNVNQGILGNGSSRVTILQNKIYHNGPHATSPSDFRAHGLYINGSNIVVRKNVIYDSTGFGIQLDGTKSYIPGGTYASAEFAESPNWIIESNTIAYNQNRGAIVLWGGNADGARIENNIFYENNDNNPSGDAQGISYFSATGSTGVLIRNNHSYGTGATAFTVGTAPADVTLSGNVINVSAPAFVNGGTNSLPASPDFRLTASAPVDICRTNEFTNNSTCVVGAYKTVATPTAAITANKITVTLPMSTAVPVQNLSTAGVSVGCTGSACPGSPTVSNVSLEVNTDTQVGITISGITGNACEAANQTWTVSYTTASGTWTTNDNIGTYPGSHQTIFSFTSLAVTNNCTGTGPTGYPAGYYIHYKFDEGTGTSANDESANNLDGTLTNSPTWAAGKTGYGVVMTGNDTKHVAIPYGSGVNPSTQSLTIAFGVYVDSGMESLTRGYFGSPLGTNQRFYISTASGTWRMGVQSNAAASAGSIAVTSGWHSVCMVADSGSDVATLYIDGVASTATISYTSFTLSGNFQLGRIGDVSTGASATYDDLLIYQSVQSCADISTAFHADPPAIAGALDQVAIQFQGVILDTAGSSIVIGSAVQSIEVPASGGVVLLFQIHCTNVSNCDPTAFKLVYAKNGSSTWIQVPDIETADGTWMWGITTDTNLNNGTRSTRLTGSCTMTTGATQVTSAQTPSVDLPQDGCTVQAYIVRVGSTQAGNYFDYKLRTEADADLTTVTQTARVRVVNPMASGIGF